MILMLIVTFISFWDPYDNIPKLSAESLSLGMSPICGALGPYAVVNNTDKLMPNPFFPILTTPNLKYMVFVPFFHHSVSK